MARTTYHRDSAQIRRLLHRRRVGHCPCVRGAVRHGYLQSEPLDAERCHLRRHRRRHLTVPVRHRQATIGMVLIHVRHHARLSLREVIRECGKPQALRSLHPPRVKPPPRTRAGNAGNAGGDAERLGLAAVESRR